MFTDNNLDGTDSKSLREISVFEITPVGTEADLEDLHDQVEDKELKPTIDTTIREFYEKDVNYTSGRGPDDAVLSGPVLGGWGPGRYFRSKYVAKQWLVSKFGQRRVVHIDGNIKGRWAFLIKDLKKGHNAVA